MRLGCCLPLPGPAASRGLPWPAPRQALFLSRRTRHAHVMTSFSGRAEGLPWCQHCEQGRADLNLAAVS